MKNKGWLNKHFKRGTFFTCEKFPQRTLSATPSKTRLKQKNLEALPQTSLAFEKARQNFYGKLRFPDSKQK